MTEITDRIGGGPPPARIGTRLPGGLQLRALSMTVPAVAPTVVALALRRFQPPWAFMWVLSYAIFLGCKWLTWRRAIRHHPDAPLARSIAYMVAWPGMDADAFLAAGRVPPPPLSRWIEPALKAGAGVTLLWGAVRLVPPDLPLLRGWAGLLGLVLLLHFGTFHLLALAWRRAGVDAVPLMDRPTRARSLGELWGRRWNRGFHQLATNLCFRPLARRAGPTAAVLATFAASGVVHDLVISLPAGAGFGGPTAYFLIQGVGACVERAPAARRLGLDRGWAGRAFTAAVALGPLPLLFHGPFLRRVIVPFLHVIGAG